MDSELFPQGFCAAAFSRLIYGQKSGPPIKPLYYNSEPNYLDAKNIYALLNRGDLAA